MSLPVTDDISTLQAVILRTLGSPDPNYSSQMDGLGGGYSSVSKVAVLSDTAPDGSHVNYLFGQVKLTL